MKLVPLTSISVGENRQRREFKPTAIFELASSISRIGLLHPLVVRETESGFTLVAGERRLRAIADMAELGGQFRFNNEIVPAGHVPVVSLGELPPLEAWEAELEENIRRVDLTWQERAKATAALVELRRAQALDREEPAPPLSEIAREIHDLPPELAAGEMGYYATSVRDDVIVSKFLHDPDVAAASSTKEAIKILKRKEERKRNEQLAVTVGRTFSAAEHRLLNADSLDWMRGAPPAQFDIILTDPPYGMNAHEFNDSGTGAAGAAAHFYEDSYDVWRSIVDVLAPESFRLAKEQAHLYCFCDIDRFTELRMAFAAAGWQTHRTPLIWHNPDGFRAPWPQHGPQRKYELILYAIKGGRQTTALRPDVIEARKDSAEGHPAQKPIALLEDLLRRSAKPGDAVFDPFAGSGSTLVAAHNLKLRCTAIEKDASAYGIAARRLGNLELQPALF